MKTNPLMTHMVCGYPNMEESKNIFHTLDQHSRYIEIQFPFSDPIADGPIISDANRQALKNGFKTEQGFDFINSITEQGVKSQVLIMTYYNIVLNYGVKTFFEECKKSGVYGCIIPDIVINCNDFQFFHKEAIKNGIHIIQTLSPVTTEERIKSISSYVSGFVYAISSNMTTGGKGNFGGNFREYINLLRSNLPEKTEIGVGFGIKTRQDVLDVLKVGDFAIVGSESIKQYNSGGIQKLRKYIEEISSI